jgi:hypothetical protein
LKMNFKSVSLNQPLRFPFKFPSGFNPIDFWCITRQNI